MGAIAIFALTEEAPGLRKTCAEIFGERYFSAANQLPASDSDASAALLRWLDELPKSAFAPPSRADEEDRR
jgi:hypothetical protein